MSGKVINLSIVREQRETSLEGAWQRFVEADARAKATLRMEDGIAAGKAYREFLELSARAS